MREYLRSHPDATCYEMQELGLLGGEGYAERMVRKAPPDVLAAMDAEVAKLRAMSPEERVRYVQELVAALHPYPA